MKQCPSNLDSLEKCEEQSSVFEKLHTIGKTRCEVMKLNEEVKKHRELQYCTFHPKINNPYTPQRNNTIQDIYERLSYSDKKERLKLFEAQKTARELQFCTFEPSVKNKTFGYRSKSVQQEPIYYRQSRQKEVQERLRKSKEMEKRNRELDGCTFTPNINSGRIQSENSSFRQRNYPYDRLYKDNERKKQQQVKKEIAHDEEILASYSFKPKISSSKNPQQDSETASKSKMPKYMELFEKHQQKQQLMEQKRKELIEEEQKMHQFISGANSERKHLRTPSTKWNCSTHEMTNGKNPSSSAKKEVIEKQDIHEKLYKTPNIEKNKQEDLVQKVMQVFKFFIKKYLGARSYFLSTN